MSTTKKLKPTALFTARTRARKRAVDTLFEADQRGLGKDPQALRELLQQRQEISTAQSPLPSYAVTLVEGVCEHLLSIDDLLAVHSTGRAFDRLPAVDRAILRMAAWEIIWNEEVPAVTAIDEAVHIAKTISTDESPATVNAILDALRRDKGQALAAEEALSRALAAPDQAPLEENVETPQSSTT